jgi:benzoyl-CoA-dihydrodiol lyase
VSFPETPLLAVLPGTGGLTRLVDKRKVRRDRADVFCTLAEGIKGKRAKDWGLVDEVVPRTKWDEAWRRRAALAAQRRRPPRPRRRAAAAGAHASTVAGVVATSYVELEVDRATRTATLDGASPTDRATARGPGQRRRRRCGALRAFRELDDALLRLRFNEPRSGGDGAHRRRRRRWCWRWTPCWPSRRHERLRARGPPAAAARAQALDNTARSLFAVADRADSCFSGVLLELALAADRMYMLIDGDEQGRAAHLGRQRRLLHHGDRPVAPRRRASWPARRRSAGAGARRRGRHRHSEEAERLGLATIAADDIDFADELRIAVEERASLSPDALTGMEASLRFAGPETLETKIFGRLSAWQNWIFTRGNATGERGALTLYGKARAGRASTGPWTREP